MKPLIDEEFEGKFEGLESFSGFCSLKRWRVCKFLLDIEMKRLQKRRKKGGKGLIFF